MYARSRFIPIPPVCGGCRDICCTVLLHWASLFSFLFRCTILSLFFMIISVRSHVIPAHRLSCRVVWRQSDRQQALCWFSLPKVMCPVNAYLVSRLHHHMWCGVAAEPHCAFGRSLSILIAKFAFGRGHEREKRGRAQSALGRLPGIDKPGHEVAKPAASTPTPSLVIVRFLYQYPPM